MQESQYQHFIECNLPQHRQLAANAWSMLCKNRESDSYKLLWGSQISLMLVS